LLALTMRSINLNLPLFPNLLEEPVLYRLFHTWVEEGLVEAQKIKSADETVQKKVLGAAG
jgi:hypothetical protein